jgi:hypothetical protein
MPEELVRLRALLHESVSHISYQVSSFSSEPHLMRHKDHRLTGLPKIRDDVEHLRGHLGIQSGRGLVQKEELWIDSECSGNGDPLALTTAKLGRFLACVRPEAQALENSSRSLMRIGESMNFFQREQNILQGRKMWKEIVRLEDDADLTPMCPQSPLLKDKRIAIETDRAGVGIFKPGYYTQQGRLSAAGRPNEGHRVLEVGMKANPLQNLVVSEGLLNAVAFNGHGGEERGISWIGRERSGSGNGGSAVRYMLGGTLRARLDFLL